ncbi:MAG: DNA polymerase 1 [Candidatus Methanofastidiosum methylothiophilum]|uniref:DNA-directed DNA polymerase n=1 Tax=Candidatus Methanofastidiosum methylothiophilum TaxID=1705564 RepID=A0A150IVK5_9EURY|nr:MAG: DNA polymerase 1 [Candidatus Methanofastidiosum methylthiophilus]
MQAKQLESYRLDAVAFEELGERKIHVPSGVAPLWRNEPDKLVEYNVKDVELCIGIDKKNNIIEFYREIAKYVGCHMERTLASSLVVDTYVLRKAHGKYVLPSKNYAAEGEEFKGATVFEPSSGVFENVVVFDLKSLYPMSMMTLNASMETKDPNGENISPNGVRFKKEPDGITRELISDLLKQRDEKKRLRNTFPHGSRDYEVLDMQQNVIKVIMNTYYGVSGFPKFRLYDRDIGSAVTATGRAIIEFTKNVVEEMGYSILYGDTDSVLISFGKKFKSNEEIIQTSKTIESVLNKKYDTFAKDVLKVDKHYFSTKFEKLYDRFFQAGKKKRYAGHLVWKEGVDADKIDIVGFETRRSDTPPVVKEILTTVINMIVKGEPESNVQMYVKEVVRKYRRGEYPLEQIGIPSGISKKFEEYKNHDIRVRASEYSNVNFGTNFTAGSKPKRVYIRSISDRKYPKTDVVAFEFSEQIPKEFIIDYETMLNKTLRDPIMRIIEPLGWTWTDMDPTRTSLAQFGIDI